MFGLMVYFAEICSATKIRNRNRNYKFNDEAFLIMNLISFRRETISRSTLDRLISIEDKLETGRGLSCEEKKLIEAFYAQKQILPPDIVEEVDRRSEKDSELHQLKFPVKSITFNLTHSCNFNCDYCYQRKYKNKPEYVGSMSIEDINSIMEYLHLPCFGDTELDEYQISLDGLARLLHRPVNERRDIKYKKCDLTKTVSMVFEPNGDIYGNGKNVKGDRAKNNEKKSVISWADYYVGDTYCLRFW